MLATLLFATVADDAQDLYSQVCRKLFDAPTLRVEMVVNPDREYVPYTLAFEKSGRYSVRSPRQGIVADESLVWTWFEQSNTYKRSPVPKPAQMPFIGVGLRGFYSATDEEFKATELMPTVYLHADAKRLKLEPAKTNSQYAGLHWFVYIGADGLPKGYEQWAPGLQSPLLRAEYRKIELGGPVDPALFAWTPPSDYVDTSAGNGGAPPIKPAVRPTTPPTATLPAVVGKLLSGVSFDLTAAVKKSKLTILAFWESNAPTNKADLAFLKGLHTKYGAKGLTIVSANRGSSDASLVKSLDSQNLRFPTFNGASSNQAATAFVIQTRPTYLLIGPDLKIRERTAEVSKLTPALTRAGFKP